MAKKKKKTSVCLRSDNSFVFQTQFYYRSVAIAIPSSMLNIFLHSINTDLVFFFFSSVKKTGTRMSVLQGIAATCYGTTTCIQSHGKAALICRNLNIHVHVSRVGKRNIYLQPLSTILKKKKKKVYWKAKMLLQYRYGLGMCDIVKQFLKVTN